MFWQVLNENFILLIFLIVGYALAKSKILHDIHVEGLSKILTYVALPSACFISLQTSSSPEIVKEVLFVIGISTVLLFACFLSGIVFTNMFGIRLIEKKVWNGCITFSNVMFVGIPLIGVIYGDEGILLLVCYNTVSMFLLFTLGVTIYDQKEKNKINLKQLFFNPAILFTIVGFIFFAINYKVPTPIYEAFHSFGNLTAPVSMIIAGAMMKKNNFVSFISDYKVYLFSFIRLIILPVFTFLALSPFIKDSLVLGVLVLASAMPAGAMNAVLAEEYGANGAVASKYIVMTTLLSIISLPLMSLLIS